MTSDLERHWNNKRPTEEFYSLFYLGLFNEARGETSKAESYMKAAVKSTYAKAVGSRDYMVDCAKVRQYRGSSFIAGPPCNPMFTFF